MDNQLVFIIYENFQSHRTFAKVTPACINDKIFVTIIQNGYFDFVYEGNMFS
jgi:hypothetical protein